MNFSGFNKNMRVITLSGICIALYLLISSDTILRYLHPRSLPLIKGTWLLLAILTLNELRLFIRRTDKKVIDWRYFVIWLPVIFVLYVKPTGLSSRIAVQKGLSSMALKDESKDIYSKKTFDDTLEDSEIIKNAVVNHVATSSDTLLKSEMEVNKNQKTNEEKSQLTPKLIVTHDTINEDSFTVKLDRIYSNPNKWSGKSITMKGFITPDTILGRNSFFLARMMISCCAADAEPVGFFCVTDSVIGVHENDWVILTGREESRMVKFPWDEEKRRIPVLRVTNIQKAERPGNEYVYPISY